jgi:aspartyl/asparaginyl beta-hydroxylase (cupin superfamily)
MESIGAPGGTASARDLNSAAVRAMSAGDFGGARSILQKAVLQFADSTALWLNLAACCRAQSDISGAISAVDGALKTDPRSFMGLLMKGSLLERQGHARQAAKIYGFAIALAPAADSLDAATRSALQRARAMNARYVDELADFVDERIGPLRQRGRSAEVRRVNKFIDIAVRRRTMYRQDPSDFFYPGLPNTEFYERDEFPWLEALESNTAKIREELLAVLKDDFRDFVPYVNYADSVPLDQWAELNHSMRWGALHLYLSGKPVEQNCRRCPDTMAAIEGLPQPRMPNRSPAALFSALQPQTRIPPHTGVANTRLVVHLPLIVPEGCAFRVGNEVRPWREGEAWVFDDTIEHEAWNDSQKPRIIFICDIWNPRLSADEQDLITEVIAAMDAYHGGSPKADI